MDTTASTLANYSPSIGYRLRAMTERAKYWLQKTLLRAAIALSNESSYARHAKREMLAAGYKSVDEDEVPNKWIQQNVLELLAVFSMQGHSGFSAPYCIDMFQKLAKFEPLVPLSGAPDEWTRWVMASSRTTDAAMFSKALTATMANPTTLKR